MAQRSCGEDLLWWGIFVLEKKAWLIWPALSCPPHGKDNKRTRNPKQTAWSYGLRLGAISADHGDCMCARCGKVIVVAGDGEGGAAVLGYHTDGTPQGLQVFWGQADLPIGREKMSWSTRRGRVCCPR